MHNPILARGAALALSLAVATPAASTQDGTVLRLDQTVEHPGPAPFAYLGWSIGVSGDSFLVGGAAQAHVYVRGPAGWAHEADLVSPMPVGYTYGRAVALFGDTAVIGHSAGDEVFVFVRQAGTWSLEQTITDPDGPHPGNGFGQAVAISGDTILVGAPHGGPPIVDLGFAYAFTRQGGVWSQETRLVPSDLMIGDNYGGSVALQGDFAVVSAFNDNAGEGAVYTFQRNAGVWTEGATLTVTNPGGASAGVWGLSLDGDRIVALERLNLRVHLFERTGGSWSLGTVFTLPAEPEPANGMAISIAGDRFAVGAPAHTVDGAIQTGSVYVFGDDGTSFRPLARLVAPGVSQGRFGQAVHLVGDELFSGAPMRDGIGAVYVHELLPDVGTSYCGPATPNSGGRPARIFAAGSDVRSDDRLFLEAKQLPRHTQGYFLASRSPGLLAQPGGSLGTLCLGLPIGRYDGPLLDSTALGAIQLELDLAAVPLLGAVAAGETWYFQAWFRDVFGGADSNFSDGVAITFL
ncbi:MAG: hypothetical protein GY711_33390 [bacterium]|nr:hypothetical protein [bacterium]